MKPQEAIQGMKFYKEKLHNGIFKDNIGAFDIAISALEKQMPKKPYKSKDHKQNDYYCNVCKRYLGDEMELKYACLQPTYCEHCGQALDWSGEE